MIQLIILAATTFVLSGAIILSSKFVPQICGAGDAHLAVQSAHKRPTSRLGGFAIFIGLLASLVIVPLDVDGQYGLFLMSASCLFIVGLAEDLGFKVSPLRRLLAAMLASLLVVLLLDVWLPRADIPGLDGAIDYWIIGVPLTLLITAGIANGFNLIDGVNGLASVTAFAAAFALAVISHNAGYTVMVELATILAACILGFFLLNFPYGLIFLGDAGAYTIGFVLSWFGIAVLINVPDASAWAILLTMFWPVADTMLAIYRRLLRNVSTVAPDRLHVHQLVMRALEIYVLGRGRRHMANPMTTIVLAPFVFLPPVAGIMLWNRPELAVICFFVFLACFFALYTLAFQMFRHLKRRSGFRERIVNQARVFKRTSAHYPIKHFSVLKKKDANAKN